MQAYCWQALVNKQGRKEQVENSNNNYTSSCRVVPIEMSINHCLGKLLCHRLTSLTSKIHCFSLAFLYILIKLLPPFLLTGQMAMCMLTYDCLNINSIWSVCVAISILDWKTAQKRRPFPWSHLLVQFFQKGGNWEIGWFFFLVLYRHLWAVYLLRETFWRSASAALFIGQAANGQLLMAVKNQSVTISVLLSTWSMKSLSQHLMFRGRERSQVCGPWFYAKRTPRDWSSYLFYLVDVAKLR